MADLKQYFPMIQERKEVLEKIHDKKELLKMFYSWTEEQQEEFLSLILGTPVKIHAVFPNDSTRLADESSLLITDIVVELKDGSLANVELLQKYVFIPIDIFKKRQQNKGITGKLDAWLMFFCGEKPEEIVRLIETYPQFNPMYEEAYEMCRNMEDIMGLFSKELRELDRNTVQLMIDEMQEELEQKRAELEKRKEEIKKQEKEAERQKEEIKKQKEEAERRKMEAEQQRNAAEAEKLRADRLEESEREKSEQLEQALRRIAELEKRKV